MHYLLLTYVLAVCDDDGEPQYYAKFRRDGGYDQIPMLSHAEIVGETYDEAHYWLLDLWQHNAENSPRHIWDNACVLFVGLRDYDGNIIYRPR